MTYLKKSEGEENIRKIQKDGGEVDTEMKLKDD